MYPINYKWDLYLTFKPSFKTHKHILNSWEKFKSRRIFVWCLLFLKANRKKKRLILKRASSDGLKIEDKTTGPTVGSIAGSVACYFRHCKNFGSNPALHSVIRNDVAAFSLQPSHHVLVVCLPRFWLNVGLGPLWVLSSEALWSLICRPLLILTQAIGKDWQ